MPPLSLNPSSNVASAEYDPATMLLTVEFKSGDVYVYSGVDKVTAEGLSSATSPGGYVSRILRGRFPHKRL